MTSDEYREVLDRLTEQQRRALNDHIFLGNQPTDDQMVHTFQRYADVEAQAVFWLGGNVPWFQEKTQVDRVAEANIRSAELAERSLAVSQNSLEVSRKSLRAAYWAIAVALLALLASVVAIFK